MCGLGTCGEKSTALTRVDSENVYVLLPRLPRSSVHPCSVFPVAAIPFKQVPRERIQREFAFHIPAQVGPMQKVIVK